MRTFTGQKPIAIFRQTYTGTPLKSSYLLQYGTTTGVSAVTGYLRPLTEEASTINGIQYGYGFNLIVEVDVDVKEGDQVVIAGVTYNVRGVVVHDRGTVTQYKRALMLKSEKQ